jgi:lipopolysaccharide transport system permease protein
LVGASHLISKVYFPRLLVPAAAVLASLVDLMVACGLLGAMMLWYRSPVLPTLLLLPAVVLLACGLAAGVGLWLSALNVEYRDVRVVIPFVLQLWMYATPVVYPLSVLPPAFEAVALLNPMTGVVEAFRGCLFGLVPAWRVLGIALLATLVLLSSGALYFRRTERTFADML